MTEKSGINWQAFKDLQNECLELAQKKNARYGTENLVMFNGTAILVRMNDKIARLNNLYKSGEFGVCDEVLKEETDESILDTCMDLINYAMYMVLLREGHILYEVQPIEMPNGSCE